MSDLIKREEVNSSPDSYHPPRSIEDMDDFEAENLSSTLLRARDFFFRVILKHKWLILAVIVTSLGLAALQSFTTTPLYRAMIEIQVDPGFDRILPHGGVTDTSYIATGAYLETQTKVIQSRALAKRVVQRLNLVEDPRFNTSTSSGVIKENLSLSRLISLVYRPLRRLLSGGTPAKVAAQADSPPDREAIIESYARRLRVGAQVPRNSRSIEISYVSPYPDLAAEVVNTVAEEFIALDLDSRYETTIGASEFLEKQLRELQIQVEKSEEKLNNYARAYNILNIERDNIVLQKLSDLNRQMTAIESRLNAEQAKYSLIEKATVENFPESFKNPSIGGLEKQLSGLEQQLAILLGRFGPRWPKVIELKEQIAQVEVQLGSEKQRALEEAKLSLQTSLQEQSNIFRSLEEQKQRAGRLNENLIQYNILQREVETNQKLYEGLLQRMKEAGISANLKSSNIRIIDRAAAPGSPYTPQTGMNLVMGLLLGLALGCGLATLLHAFDNTIKTPDEVERSVGLPSLGIIPIIRALKEVTRQDETTSLVPCQFEPEDPAIIPYKDFSSRSWEPYRAFRTSILLSHSDKPPAVLLVSSPLSGEGKTTTAVNLSIVLAQTGARTLLMDLDMRKPRLGAIFGVKGEPGMSVFLSGNSDQVPKIQTAVPNLFLATAGKQPPNPAELIGSKRMGEALQSLRQEFDFVVIDSPPLLSCTDGVVLSPRVDGVVLVAHSANTTKNSLKKANHHLWSVGAKVLGVLMNNVDLDQPEFSYYYREYHQHYHYYQHEVKT